MEKIDTVANVSISNGIFYLIKVEIRHSKYCFQAKSSMVIITTSTWSKIVEEGAYFLSLYDLYIKCIGSYLGPGTKDCGYRTKWN